MGIIIPKVGTLVTPDSIGKVLFGKTRRAVLGLLFASPDQAFYVNEIVREAGLGVGTVQRELRTLTRAGLLRRTKRGNQVFFQANPDCPTFPELRALVEKTMGAPVVLSRLLSPWRDRIRIALIYGSFARGEAGAESDVDLLVVGEVPALELAAALRPAQERLRRDVNPVVFSPREFRDRVRREDHFTTAVLREPKVFLLGDENELGRLAGKRTPRSPQPKPR